MNWGTKIVLGMIAFMLFITGMVVYMFKVQDNDSLVEEDYYEKGINYDQEYNAKKNALEEGATPVINVANNQITITLRDAADYELLLLRPSAAKLDIKSIGRTVGKENVITFETGNLKRGLWSLNLSWKVNGKDYLYQKNITL